MHPTTEISKKEAIFRSAALLFTERGYAATSMRHLAASVGLEVSSIYSHIQSKEELLTELCMDCANRFMEGMASVCLEGGDPADQLDKLIQLHINIAFDTPASVTVFNKEWRHLPEPARTRFIDYRNAYETSFMQILEQGRKKGVFAFDDTGMMFRIILQTIRFSYFSVRKFSREELITEVRRFVTHGIYKR